MGGTSVWMRRDEMPYQAFICGKRTRSDILVMVSAEETDARALALPTTAEPPRTVHGRPLWCPRTTEFRTSPTCNWATQRNEFPLYGEEAICVEALAEVVVPTPKKTRGPGSPVVEGRPEACLLITEPLPATFGDRPLHPPVGLPAPFETRGASLEMARTPDRAAPEMATAATAGDVAKLVQMLEGQQRAMGHLQRQMYECLCT